ncbi:MAG: hypothetical protein AVDCRST_MAG83-3364 [uncultured Arthrobacter sp.]|uniref:Uncharacterized protein n=1 Tax=uncultured Arthrobacter sp. TaxID=114050 RepID=A0A6J4J987_9MICC|nr:MAG: hypothetical protein AVDCRST_MAG83-3364 [uncultured Arthrobacter sp.]
MALDNDIRHREDGSVIQNVVLAPWQEKSMRSVIECAVGELPDGVIRSSRTVRAHASAAHETRT